MEAGLSSDVTGEPGLSDRGGHGTITAFQVPGRSLTRTFSNESEFSLGCSNADLTEHASVRDIVTIQFDADGSIARFIDDVNFVGVITNNDTGETFRDPGHITNIFDTSTATFRQIGLVFAITIPGRGVVALDAGKITFFPDGSVEVRGPHEVFDGLDLCDVLG